MKKLSPRARKVMDQLTKGLKKLEDHITIDNSPGTFMAVHVEHIGNCNQGPMFSVTHYYKQNGDLMKDPDMVFIKGNDNEYYPIEFQQDNIAFYSCAVRFNEKGVITKYHPLVQKDMVAFADNWMVNIMMQQNLNPEESQETTDEKAIKP